MVLSLAAYGTLVRTCCDICGELAFILIIESLLLDAGQSLLSLSLYLRYTAHEINRAISPNNSARIKPRSHVLDNEEQQDVSRRLQMLLPGARTRTSDPVCYTVRRLVLFCMDAKAIGHAENQCPTFGADCSLLYSLHSFIAMKAGTMPS